MRKPTARQLADLLTEPQARTLKACVDHEGESDEPYVARGGKKLTVYTLHRLGLVELVWPPKGRGFPIESTALGRRVERGLP